MYGRKYILFIMNVRVSMALEKANSMVAQLKRGTLAMLVLYLLQNEDM